MSISSFITLDLPQLTDLLLAAQNAGKVVETAYPEGGGATALTPAVRLAVEVGVLTLGFAIILCLYRIMRGPHLADRVLAADALSLQVVGLVILLTLRLGTTAFFDVALVVAIIGFASTLAFAQYIGAHAQAKQEAAAES